MHYNRSKWIIPMGLPIVVSKGKVQFHLPFIDLNCNGASSWFANMKMMIKLNAQVSTNLALVISQIL